MKRFKMFESSAESSAKSIAKKVAKRISRGEDQISALMAEFKLNQNSSGYHFPSWEKFQELVLPHIYRSKR